MGKNILFSQHVGGKNEIKLKCQFFFLVGANFISLEDPSPTEYTESGLMEALHGVLESRENGGQIKQGAGRREGKGLGSREQKKRYREQGAV